MTEQRKDTDTEKKKTDEAWLRMQAAMAGEQPHASWDKWDREGGMAAAGAAGTVQDAPAAEAASGSGLKIATAADVGAEDRVKTAASANAKPRRRMGGRARRWTTVAAAALIVVTAAATPAGNKALASILGQFRMEQVVSVDENELQRMFQSFSDGQVREAINRFGTFTSESERYKDNLSREQASAELNFAMLPESLTGKQEAFFISGGQTVTLKMNVDEINKVMKQMGASKLMPASVDGKEVKLETSKTVSYDLANGENGQYASISQQLVPTVEVEPGIGLEDARDAVLQFPLLPQSLRAGLQQSEFLSTGNLVMPVITDGKSENITVQGISVILSKFNYSDNGQDRYSATWVKDGQLFTMDGGSLFAGKLDAFKAKLQELISA
ncbi:hypothetical protein ACLBWT_13780 [Paenibacillus sp. D51F]